MLKLCTVTRKIVQIDILNVFLYLKKKKKQEQNKANALCIPSCGLSWSIHHPCCVCSPQSTTHLLLSSPPLLPDSSQSCERRPSKSRIDWDDVAPGAGAVTLWQSFMEIVTHVLTCLQGEEKYSSMVKCWSFSQYFDDFLPSVVSSPRCVLALHQLQRSALTRYQHLLEFLGDVLKFFECLKFWCFSSAFSCTVLGFPPRRCQRLRVEAGSDPL